MRYPTLEHGTGEDSDSDEGVEDDHADDSPYAGDIDGDNERGECDVNADVGGR